MLSTIAVYPHRRGTTNRYRHDEQIEHRNHGEQAGQCAKLHIGHLARAQRDAHLLKRDLMVIKRIIAVLNSQHPRAEQEPQDRGDVAPVKRASSCSASRPLNGAAIQLAIVENR